MPSSRRSSASPEKPRHAQRGAPARPTQHGRAGRRPSEEHPKPSGTIGPGIAPSEVAPGTLAPAHGGAVARRRPESGDKRTVMSIGTTRNTPQPVGGHVPTPPATLQPLVRTTPAAHPRLGTHLCSRRCDVVTPAERAAIGFRPVAALAVLIGLLRDECSCLPLGSGWLRFADWIAPARRQVAATMVSQPVSLGPWTPLIRFCTAPVSRPAPSLRPPLAFRCRQCYNKSISSMADMKGWSTRRRKDLGGGS